MMTYEEAVRGLNGRGMFLGKNSYEHTKEFLRLLGEPQRSAGEILHIAGTNGKGSVSAFLESAFRAAGNTTGRFISPHLVRVNERIAVNGTDISDGDFARAYEAVYAADEIMTGKGEPPLGYFEFVMMMALVYFAERGTDVTILETGLGGRLDATNRVDPKVLTVITSIGMDHMKLLGNSISEIAGEKAAILRPGVPCVFYAGSREAEKVIRRKADSLGAPVCPLYASDYIIDRAANGVIDFSTSFRYDGRAEFRIRAFAPYQVQNAALAVLALRTLEDRGDFAARLPDAEQTAAGLESMYWPARMEEILPRVYLDGAHNEDGIRAFVQAARALKGNGPMHLLFAAVSDKDYRQMIRMLAEGIPWADVTVTEIGGERNLEAGIPVQLFREAGVQQVTAVPVFEDAFREVLRRQGDGSVCICGSLYLAGLVKELNV